jgi:murein DD-endopeptidase MepM/ murein hydrolase activator NlpD
MMSGYGYRRSAGNKIKSWWIVLLIAVVALAAVLFLVLSGRERRTAQFEESPQEVVVKDTLYRYGLPIEYFSVLYDTVAPHQTLAELLMENGLTASKVYALTSQCPDSVFDVRKVRAGQPCALLSNLDSMATPRYFVYEVNAKEYAVFNLMTNQVTRGEHPSEWRERVCGGVVESSLWNAMVASDASPQLAVMLSHIFGWTIDFFGIQKGDEFRLIYEQEYVEDRAINNFMIRAASFCASDSLYYAIPFVQEGEELYYNEKGNSLEGAFLKAPLDYYRISSRFTNSRYHPVLKRYRAHHGVDYAAPTGTPVYAIGSGKVIDKGFQANGGGNYVKIRHNSTYTTTYMHLSRFAKGLKVGDMVAQKEVIGYVGSTGLSTGPHLDFRVYENGKPINPLTIKSQPKKPISEENKEAFRMVCDSLVLRLKDIQLTSQIPVE